MKWHGGKGSGRRSGANDTNYRDNYDSIFKKKDMWQHLCAVKDGWMSFEKDTKCDWCGESEFEDKE